MNSSWVPSINALFPAVNGRPFVCYNDVIDYLKPPSDTGVILVAHSYETVFALASSVAYMGNLRGVILKNSTALRFPEVRDELTKANIPVLNLTKKDMVSNTDEVVETISSAVPSDEKFVIMDHGGYFAYDKGFFDAFPPDRLVGISEHTLNGEDRYKALKLNDRPIVSIAKCDIKAPSDKAAADAIYSASHNYLLNGGIELKSDFLKIGVIGVGRLGSRIAENLHPKKIMLNDIFPSIMRGKWGVGTEKKSLCKKADVIFCATGNYALQPEHWSLLKNNAVVLTVTSPDDELHLDDLVRDGVLEPVPERQRGDTYVYRVTKTENEILLPFNGESANTSLTYGIANPTVHQAHAAHIAATISVMDKDRFNLSKGVQPMSSDMENSVCKIWKKHFGNEARLPETAYVPKLSKSSKSHTPITTNSLH